MTDPRTLFPPEILAAAEEAFDNLLCNDSESCGGTEGVRNAAITDISNALMAERHRWFVAIDEHKDEIERLRRRIANVMEAARG